MRNLALLLAACVLLTNCQLEEGCTDPMASNYNVDAVEDNGTCEYIEEYPPTIGGYTYDVVEIGDLIWFAENLRTAVYANGDSIPSLPEANDWISTNEGATIVYGEGSSYCLNWSPIVVACDEVQSLEAYGRLYNWYAVNDERGLCPSGWRVPSDEDWFALYDYIEAQGFELTVGTALKSTFGWNFDLYEMVGDGTDDFGFSAHPGGMRFDDSIGEVAGAFHGAGSSASWWSSTPDGANASSFQIFTSYPYLWPESYSRRRGYSVRCVMEPE